MIHSLMAIPLDWIAASLETLAFRDIKQGLSWFYQATQDGNALHSSEELAHLVGHRKCDMTQWLNDWMEQGLASVQVIEDVSYYQLTPVSSENAWLLTLETYQRLLTVRPMERLVYLWIQTHPKTKSHQTFMDVFHYQHPHTVYGVLRELKKAGLIQFKREREAGQLVYRFTTTPIKRPGTTYYPSTRPVVEPLAPSLLALPDVLWDEMQTLQDFYAIRFYLDWLVYLQKTTSHPLTIHELIHNVLSATNHHTVQLALTDMMKKGWVRQQKVGHDTFYELQPQLPINWSFVLSKPDLTHVLAVLKAKELGIWLWLQAYQPDVIDVEELTEEIGANNEAQTLNILKRMGARLGLSCQKVENGFKMDCPRLGVRELASFAA